MITPRFQFQEQSADRFRSQLLRRLRIVVHARQPFWLAMLSFAVWAAFVLGASLATAQDDSQPLVEVTLNQAVFKQLNLARSKKPIELRIWIEGADPSKFPPLSGESSVSGDGVVFKPDFPFRAGKKYFARVAGNEEVIEFEIPKPASTPTKVINVFPTADRLPENILKFYVHFSSPMRKGDIYRYVRLARIVGEKREEIELPFLEVEQELWSRDHLRLTLLIDPGRIKRGLKPREEAGPVFEDGGRYELTIDGEWPDASGRQIGDSGAYRKSFKVVEPDNLGPAPKKWKLVTPKAGSSSPLRLNFHEPLDSGLLLRLIRVADESGKEVSMVAEVGSNQESLTLTPDKPWSEANYQLQIDNRLEDLCGNSIGRPFDVDVFEKIERPESDGVTQLKFVVEAK